MDYKYSKHHVYLLNYHVVWCPKRRKSILIGKIRERLLAIIEDVTKELDCDIMAVEVMPDHVHLFISTNPLLPVHKIIKTIKGRSSRILRREFPELLKLPTLWTHSYFISTAGNVSSATIKRYIEEQSKS